MTESDSLPEFSESEEEEWSPKVQLIISISDHKYSHIHSQ